MIGNTVFRFFPGTVSASAVCEAVTSLLQDDTNQVTRWSVGVNGEEGVLKFCVITKGLVFK